VFKRINKQLHSLTTLELQYVAPALVRAQVGGCCCDGGGSPAVMLTSCHWVALSYLQQHISNPHHNPIQSNQGMELAVPGTYIAGEPLVTIAAFAPQLQVISSKQRPRKLTIHGGDGAEYMFLLKGHEVRCGCVCGGGLWGCGVGWVSVFTVSLGDDRRHLTDGTKQRLTEHLTPRQQYN